MRNTLKAAVFIGIFATTAFGVLAAHAGELRVLDSMGLTRAVRSIQNSATVQVTVRSGGEVQNLMLSHIDGLAPNRGPSSVSGETATFRDVPEGSWRISAEGSKPVIAEVKIVQ